MRARAKTAVWIGAAALVVAVSALMPSAVLGLQDRALAGQVRSWEAETADLSLLAELSSAQTLAMVGQYQSRVALEQGRELDADQAERIAANALNIDVFAAYYVADHMAPSASAASAQPWLYMDATGQNVIFWQVELSGTGYNPLLAVFDDGAGASPFTAAALVDDRTGRVVSLRVQWTDFAAAAGPAEDPADAMPTVAPTPAVEMEFGEELVGEGFPDPDYMDYYIDQDMALALSDQLIYGLVDGMAAYSYGADIDPKAGTAYLRLDGEEVAVPMIWTAAELRFNA